MATEVSFAQYLSTSRGRETEEWRPDGNTKVGRLIHKLKVTKVPFSMTNGFWQAVGCPYLEGMEGPVISEVLFTPGEARMRLLTWLTAR